MKFKLRLSLFSIFSIMYLWPISIPIGTIDIPAYIPVIFLISLLLSVRPVDFVFLLISMLLMVVYYFMQQLQDIVIELPMRTYSGLLAICIIVFSLRIILRYILKYDETMLAKPFIWGIYFIFATQIIQYGLWYLGLIEGGYSHYYFNIPRMTSIFSEPSHLAVAISPAAFLAFTRKYQDNNLVILRLLIIAICVIAPSATLFIIAILLGIVTLLNKTNKQNKIKLLQTTKNLVIGLGLIAIAVISYYKIPAINIRISTILDTIHGYASITTMSNLSSVVFLKGYDMSIITLREYPLGVGFLNMSFLSEMTSISFIHPIFFNRNNNDGASLLFKFISEFGYIGVLFSCTMVYQIFRHIRVDTCESYVLAAIYFGFVATFVRGTSYFDGIAIIAIALYFLGKSKVLMIRVERGYNKQLQI